MSMKNKTAAERIGRVRTSVEALKAGEWRSCSARAAESWERRKSRENQVAKFFVLLFSARTSTRSATGPGQGRRSAVSNTSRNAKLSLRAEPPCCLPRRIREGGTRLCVLPGLVRLWPGPATVVGAEQRRDERTGPSAWLASTTSKWGVTQFGTSAICGAVLAFWGLPVTGALVGLSARRQPPAHAKFAPGVMVGHGFS